MSLSSVSVNPRVCHTGVETPYALAKENFSGSVNVDYLGITFHDTSILDDILCSFGTDWVSLPYGRMGYKNAFTDGGITVYSGGTDAMGVHVVASGKGCRQLEAKGIVSDWSSWFGAKINAGCTFSRIDLALDDFDGLIVKDKVFKSARSGEICHRFKSVSLNENMTSSGIQSGWKVAFGSRGSSSYLRIYDKGAEQSLQGHWSRVELELRNKRALACARFIASYGLVASKGLIASAIDFKAVNHEHKYRTSSVKWWADFLQGVQKVKLSVKVVTRTLSQVKTWVNTQCGSMLAVIVEAEGGSLDFLINSITAGKNRFKQKHHDLLYQSGF